MTIAPYSPPPTFTRIGANAGPEQLAEALTFTRPSERVTLPHGGLDLVVGDSVFQGVYWINGGDVVQPVHTRLTIDVGPQFILVNEETGIFGSGASLAAAAEDFRAALVEHRALLHDEGNLSEDLRDQYNFLMQHLRHG